MNKFFEKFRKEENIQKLPSKRNINLYVREKDGNSIQVVLPLAVFLIIVVFAVYRLGVVDRLAKLAQLQQQNSALKTQLEQLDEKISNYDEVLEEYRRFTTSYLSEDEAGLVGRERIFDMLDESTEGIGNITSISIEGNQVGVIVDMSSLEDIDTIQDRLNSMVNIDEIMVSTAKGTNNIDVEGYIIFTVKEEDDDAVLASGSVSSLSEEERAARYEEYTNAVKAAREAKDNADKNANTKKAEAVYGGSLSAVNNSVGSGSNVNSSQNAGSLQQSGGNKGTNGSNVEVQNIGGDTVIIGSNPDSAPQGFATLEEGMAALQGAGQ